MFGARSAMPMHQAIRLCRNKAVVVAPRGVVYKAASARIMKLLSAQAPHLEQLSIDEAFLELGEEDSHSSHTAELWAHRVQDLVDSEVGLPCSIGLAHTKLDAKMASDLGKPHGIFVVRDRIGTFGPRPVGDLWGIGPVAQGKLREVGVTTIADFLAMDPTDVRAALGSVGVDVQRMAGGDDPRPVAPREANKQISAERTLEVDVTTTPAMLPHLVTAARHAHQRLLKDGRAARTVTVKTRTSDFLVHTRSATLSAPTDDFSTLLGAARSVAPQPEAIGAFRLVGVGFSGLVSDRQEVLFPELSAPAITHLGHGSTQDDDPVPTSPMWHATMDVYHPEHGHGWVQGVGHGIITVRFETRATGPGRTRTFPIDDPGLRPADPLGSLAWDLESEN